MIRCHLFALHGRAKSEYFGCGAADGLNRNTVAPLYHEKATRVDLEAVEKLCKLFGLRGWRLI